MRLEQGGETPLLLLVRYSQIVRRRLPPPLQAIAFASNLNSSRLINDVDRILVNLKESGESQGACMERGNGRLGRRELEVMNAWGVVAPAQPTWPPCRPAQTQPGCAGDLEQLQAEHIYPQARCKVSGVTESGASVSFEEVSG